jgi:diguanylate cyclase (GGDEF)-like protein
MLVDTKAPAPTRVTPESVAPVSDSLVLSECATYMWAQAVRSLMLVPPVALLLVLIEAPAIPTWRLWVWASLMACTVRASLTAAIRFHRTRPGPAQARRWLRIRAVTGFMHGATWGSAAILLMPDKEQRDLRLAVLTFLVAVTSSLVIAYAGSISAYLAASIPIWTPAIVVLFTTGDRFHTLLGIGASLYLVVMFLYNHEIHRRLVGNIRLGLEHAALSGHLAAANEESERANTELRRMNAVVSDLAHRDDLTGAHNRRYLMSELDRELSRARRGGGRLWFALLDLDHFKAINDGHGHLAGDAFLRSVVESVQREIRTNDCFARYGGEEFALLLPGIDRAGAVECLDRIRARVESLRIRYSDETLQCSISIGATACSPDSLPDEILNRADRALYRAKSAGRDRVCVEEPDDVSAQRTD